MTPFVSFMLSAAALIAGFLLFVTAGDRGASWKTVLQMVCGAMVIAMAIFAAIYGWDQVRLIQ